MSVKWTGRVVGANRLHAVKCVSGRPLVYNTQAYKAFQESIHPVLCQIPHITGHVDIRLEVTLAKQRDTDGVLKPVLDAIETAGVVSNDRYVRHILMTRKYHGPGNPDVLDIGVRPIEKGHWEWVSDGGTL